MARALMRVLVTRPIDDALATANRLEALGHESVIAPLLEIHFGDGDEIDLSGVQAILATSANGVRALARRSARRDIPVFAVGPQTEHAARIAGFFDVKSAQGDGEALARAVPGWAKPQAGALFHAAGTETKGDLANALQAQGFSVRTELLYEAAAVDALPSIASDALREGRLDAVLLFSPRSARIFAKCVAMERLQSACEELVTIAISRATADALAPLKFQEIRVAAHPDQDSVMALLD